MTIIEEVSEAGDGGILRDNVIAEGIANCLGQNRTGGVDYIVRGFFEYLGVAGGIGRVDEVVCRCVFYHRGSAVGYGCLCTDPDAGGIVSVGRHRGFGQSRGVVILRGGNRFEASLEVVGMQGVPCPLHGYFNQRGQCPLYMTVHFSGE